MSPFMGGFECSTHRRRDGARLDLIRTTGHDRLAVRDYALLASVGLRTARDGARWHLIEARAGRYDWSSLDPLLEAAGAAGVEVVWDLIHYGWPDWIDPWAEGFAGRFADFAGAFAEHVGSGGRYVPINEISFLSWAGGEVGYLNPGAVGRGEALKRSLCAAAILATRRIRAFDASAVIFTSEPLIHVHRDGDDLEACEGMNLAQFDALETLLGRRAPELGGGEDLVDVVGLNFYPHNQFTAARRTVWRDDPAYRPLGDLLIEAAGRIRKPIILSETGCEDEHRAGWLAYVCDEVRAANAFGAGVRSVCLYPVLDHLGWDDDRRCRNGLFCGCSEERTVYGPLAEELKRQRARGLGSCGTASPQGLDALPAAQGRSQRTILRA